MLTLECLGEQNAWWGRKQRFRELLNVLSHNPTIGIQERPEATAWGR